MRKVLALVFVFTCLLATSWSGTTPSNEAVEIGALENGLVTRADTTGESAQLPMLVNDNGLRKADNLTSNLDKLYRIDILARANGSAINKQTASLLPADLEAAVESNILALDATGQVQVYVYTTVDARLVAPPLASLGMDIQRVSHEHGIVQGMLPIAALERAAGVAGVGTIAPPERAHTNAGSQQTQGDAILKANLLRSTYGVNGTGVKVGVLSDGAEGLAQSQALGDLPGGVNTTTCDVIESAPAGEPANTTSAGAGPEGTAMAEIVYDMAPGAQIMIGYFGLNVSTSTSLDFIDAVTCLDQQNDIVVDDIGFYADGLYDGTSPISANATNSLANPANPVRGYYTAVGNDAGAHYQESYSNSGFTYSGTAPNFWRLHRYAATGSTTDPGFGLVCSTGVFCGDQVQLVPGGSMTVVLQWNDPWLNSTNDYDLLVYDPAAGQTYLMSADSQVGAGSRPLEAFSLVNPYGVPSSFFIMIGNYQNLAAARTFDSFILCSGCVTFPNGAEHNFNTRASSVSNNADAGGGVVALGAIDQADPGNNDIETFSSLGPTNDGRTKPDVTAIDGVAVTGAGGFGSPFFGTSAAAPHAAGVAALILSCKPSLKSGEVGDNPSADRTALRNAVLNTAIDLGTAGLDNTYGRGRIDALAAAASAGCTIPVTPSSTPTHTSTPTSTPTPTNTAIPTPTDTPSPTPTPCVNPDADSDGVCDALDNCPAVSNADQANFDSDGIGNGPGIAGHDTTVANGDSLGDACDPDSDNDGLVNASDSDPGGDNTYDDDGDGNTANGCFGGTDVDSGEDGPSWDANCDSKLDGAPADCGSTNTDTDGDGLMDAWEICKWGTSHTVVDSDGDGSGDCREVMDMNGNGLVTNADALFVKRGVFNIIGKDGVFDINGNGLITNADALFISRAVFSITVCQ